MNQTQPNVTVTANNDWLTGANTGSTNGSSLAANTKQQNQQYLQGLLNQAKTSAQNPIPVAQIAGTQAGTPATAQTTTQPIQLPTANISQPTQQPDYASQILQNVTQQETELQKQYGSIANKIANLVPELGGEQQMLAQEQQNAGVFKLKQDLQNINNQIIFKTAELNRDDISLANSLQQIEDKPIAMEFITGQQASVQRNAQLQRAMKTAEIGMLNAQALASQGNIQLAMQTAQNAVDAKYTPIKETLDLYQKQLQSLEPLLNMEEKKLAEERDLKVKLALSDLDYRRQNESDIQKLIVNAASQGASQANLMKASQAKTPAEAAMALGAYAGDYFKTQQLKTELRALNAGNYSETAIPAGQLTKETGFTIDDYMRGIAGTESGGQASPYNAIGPTVTSGMYKGDRAYGKYQVMGKNIPQWTKEAFGRAMSIQEFLASPDKQDALIRYRAEKDYAKHGNWDDVASIWFSGKPLAGNTASDVLGTTVPTYISKMRKNAFPGGIAGTSGITDEVKSLALQVQSGSMKLDSVPNNLRGKVAMALQNLEDPKKQSEIDFANERLQNVQLALDKIGGFAGIGGANIGGANFLSRTDLSNIFTGDKNIVLGALDNLLTKETLNALITAKSSGATFGALSNQELGLLQSSASTLNSWAIRDKDTGRLEGFRVSDSQVKAELEKLKSKLQKAIPSYQSNLPSRVDNVFGALTSVSSGVNDENFIKSL